MLDRLANRLGLVSPERRDSAGAPTGSSGSTSRRRASTAAVQTLSGGNQQRVVLAKWLATNPKVLILDGPTVGVDIRNKQGIYEVVRAAGRRAAWRSS